MLDQIVGADGDAGLVLLSADRAGPLENGMTRYSATRSGDGDLRFVCGLISANISGSFGLLNRISRPIIAKLDDRAIVRASFQLLLKESAKPELGSRALNATLMKTCLLLLLRRHFAAHRDGISLLSASEMLRSTKLAVKVIAANIGFLSRSHFSRVFRDLYGVDPTAYRRAAPLPAEQNQAALPTDPLS